MQYHSFLGSLCFFLFWLLVDISTVRFLYLSIFLVDFLGLCAKVFVKYKRCFYGS